MQKTKPIQEESTCAVPRNFLLLDSISRDKQFDNVTYGVMPDDDKENIENSIKLENWFGTIIYDDGREYHIIDITIRVPLDFPKVAPIVKFAPQSFQLERVKRMCNDDGTINNKYLSMIEWDPKRRSEEHTSELQSQR